MNTKRTKKEPLVQSRGFYIALYGCLGVLLVLAAVISYNNYTAVTRAKDLRAQQISADDLQQANASEVQSYLTPEDRGQVTTTPPALTRPSTTRQATPSPQASPTPDTKADPSAAQPADSSEPAKTTPGSTTPGSAATTPGAVTTTPAEEQKVTFSTPEPVFDEYVEGEKMAWPVLGEIVMDYSGEHVVYDRTLEQYRTNDVLCIATEVGTPVHSAYGGVVQSVTNTRQSGNMVVIDHGNGWITTYGQLQDGVLVKTGDVVSAGQVIGGVGSPSIYGVLLGNHLEFAVALEDGYLDPKSVLE